MSKVDQQLEHLAKIQAVTDTSWSSWNSPVGLTVFFFGFAIFLNGFALFAILVKYLFLMK